MREFICYSARHRSFLHIDYTFISKHLYDKTCDFDLFPLGFSDHRATTGKISITLGPNQTACWGFNSTLLQNESFLREMREQLHEVIAINKPSVHNPIVLWDEVKGFIRTKQLDLISIYTNPN